MKKITQKEAEKAAAENEEFLNSWEYRHGDYEAKIGKQANFSNTDLSGLEFNESFLDTVNFKDAKLNGTVFRYCTLTEAHFFGADLDGAIFLECMLDRSNFIEATCKNAAFIDCNIRDVKFCFADLRNTEFVDSDLENSDLKNVKINYRSNPEQFKNIKKTGIRNNYYVKSWLERQAFIADFKEYHPTLAWFWKWGSDYGRSYRFLIGWFIVTLLFFGVIYDITEVAYFDRVSFLSPYIASFINMISLGSGGLTGNSFAGELLLAIQSAAGLGFVLLTAIFLFDKIRR